MHAGQYQTGKRTLEIGTHGIELTKQTLELGKQGLELGPLGLEILKGYEKQGLKLGNRQYDLDRHQKTHLPSSGPEKEFDCPGRRYDHPGEHNFDRKDHRSGQLSKIHKENIPEHSWRKRDSLGDDGRYNANLQTPSEHKAQGDSFVELPPSRSMESVKNSNRNIKPSGLPMTENVEPPPYTTFELPKTTMIVGAEARPSKLERHRSLQDLRQVYLEYTPKAMEGNVGVEQNPPGDLGRCNGDLEAPSQLKAQDITYKDKPPLPLVKPGENPSRDQKSVKLLKTTALIRNASNLGDSQSLTSQCLYIAEETPGTINGRKKLIGHILDEEDEESLRSTDLARSRNVQIAPEPQTIRDAYISQGVKFNCEHNGLKPNNIERLPSTMTADAERSTMMITGERGARDAVETAKIVSEPNNEARTSIPDHLIHTTPLTVMIADDELMGSLLDDGIQQAQDSNDASVVDGGLYFCLALVCSLT